MTPRELESYLSLTAEIKRLGAELEVVVKQRQALAKTLYVRNGREAIYLIGDEELIIVPNNKPGLYYFTARVRWSKSARAAHTAKKKLERVARLQSFASVPKSKESLVEPEVPMESSPRPLAPRRLELSAILTRRAPSEVESGASAETPIDSVNESEDKALGCVPEPPSDPKIDCTAAEHVDALDERVVQPDGNSALVGNAISTTETANKLGGAALPVPDYHPQSIQRRVPSPPCTTILPTQPESEHDLERRRLPLVGDPHIPPSERKPRLLQIQEPSFPSGPIAPGSPSGSDDDPSFGADF